MASMEMTELLLGDQERKQMGWMISETELTRNDRIAQGAFGAVYQDRIFRGGECFRERGCLGWRHF